MVAESSRVINMLHTGFIVCLVLAIVFFLISVLLFFVFDIKNVFMVRTGRAAKKEIRKLQDENFNTGRLRAPQNGSIYGNSGAMTQSGKMTERIQEKKTIPTTSGEETEQLAGMEETELLGSTEETEQLTSMEETELLGSTEETELLRDGEETELLSNIEETTVLGGEETTVLNTANLANQPHLNRKYVILKDEMTIHTNEIV